MRNERVKCVAITADGGACSVPASGASQFCLWHDPERVEEANAARRRGGQQSRVIQQLRRQQAEITTVEGLQRLPDRMFRDMLDGKLDPDVVSVAQREITARIAAIGGISSNGHTTTFDRAEREVGELVSKLAEGGGPESIFSFPNAVANLRGSGRNQHWSEGRVGWPSDLRDDSLLDTVLVAVAEDNCVGRPPEPGRWLACGCGDPHADRVSGCGCGEAIREPPREFPQSITRADVISVCAALSDISDAEMTRRFDAWERDWFRRGPKK